MSETRSGHADNTLSQVIGTIRACTAISAQDVDFYKSLDPSIAASLNQSSTILLNLINDIVLSVDENNDAIETGSEGLENAWKNIGEVMDLLFEKSETSVNNLKRRTAAPQTGSLQYLDDSTTIGDNSFKKIVKPQLNFARPVDNTELHPFEPLLHTKPNALKPLQVPPQLTLEEDDVPAHYPQPYEYEIEHQAYDDSVLKIETPIPSVSWDESDATWVDDKKSLDAMLQVLKNARELAIDLEHHDYRTYYGITCLMQISTRDQDWLIDTIALRDELWILNEVFTNPNIIKVLHGAFMDVIWLQRDLGLYIVSLFDTYHASRLLGFPKHSLAFLLEHYARFKTSKKYQLADWRVRPLPRPLQAYARADTHFLLNIYDHLRNALIEQDKLAQVLHNSRNVAKRRYEYTSFRPKVVSSVVYSPVEKEEPWRSLMFQYNIPPEKATLVKRLYEWRDLIARRDDESPRYVAPNQLLVSLSMSAPTDSWGVLSMGSFLTDHVRTNAKALAQLIKRASSSSVVDKSENVAPGDERSLQNVSVSEIEVNHSRYMSLVGDLTGQQSCEEHKLDEGSLLFAGKPLPNETFVVYSKSEVSTVSFTDLNDRKSRIFSQTQVQEPTKAIALPSRSESPAMEEEISNGTTSTLESTEPIDTPKESKEDILVLKERKRASKPAKQSSDQTPPVKEVLDFKTAKKVLAPAGSMPSKNFKKRFDPYSAEQKGPEGLKRRKKTRGLQKSFKG
ncbi:LAME_0D10484g1_1 [Lachancea meyersii CBS 8951]|uniref:LAME_0D10484g1_1 n=1 Tax=Lachancea meyersii CBS 8951 TaxID=1266667 RepID=A0A1G4JCC2_9SACH|nr:LAME_0D10484g1_1 [Lachancea meyersii CBS 8951]